MVACGIDIVQIERIENSLAKQGSAFADRVYTKAEQEICEGRHEARRIESLAGRFAAKEAVAKALGTGIGGKGVAMTELEILNRENGAPYVVLKGHAREVSNQMQGRSISISISHDGGFAVAYCCIEYDANEEKKENEGKK